MSSTKIIIKNIWPVGCVLSPNFEIARGQKNRTENVMLYCTGNKYENFLTDSFTKNRCILQATRDQWRSQPDNLVPLGKFQSIIIIHFFRNWLFSQSVSCKYLHSGTKSSGWLRYCAVCAWPQKLPHHHCAKLIKGIDVMTNLMQEWAHE